SRSGIATHGPGGSAMIRGKSDVLYLRPRLRPLSILERFHVVIVGGGFSGVALAAHLVRHDRVLMIGSGLTMIDKLLELEACGHTGPVHALSRRGLLPRAHRRRPETLPADVQRALSDGLARAGSLRAMLRVTRR